MTTHAPHIQAPEGNRRGQTSIHQDTKTMALVTVIERRANKVIQTDSIKVESRSHEIRSTKREQKVHDVASQTEINEAIQGNQPNIVIQTGNIKSEIKNHEIGCYKNEQIIQDVASQTEINKVSQADRKRPSTGFDEDKEYVTKFQTFKRFWRPFISIKFITISLYYFCYKYGVYGFSFYIPPYLVELGQSKSQVASAMSINGVLDFISRLGIGFLARIPQVNIYILIAVNTALTGCFDVLVPLMLTSGSTYAVMVGNLAFVGLFVGGLLGLINQLIVDAVGMEKAGTGAGIFGAIFGITVLVYSQVYGRFIVFFKFGT